MLENMFVKCLKLLLVNSFKKNDTSMYRYGLGNKKPLERFMHTKILWGNLIVTLYKEKSFTVV